MKTTNAASPYPGFRFPQEIISHAVWLYFRFSLSFRDVEELLAERGVIVSYETVRNGQGSSGNAMPTSFGGVVRSLEISGSSTKCF